MGLVEDRPLNEESNIESAYNDDLAMLVLPMQPRADDQVEQQTGPASSGAPFQDAHQHSQSMDSANSQNLNLAIPNPDGASGQNLDFSISDPLALGRI